MEDEGKADLPGTEYLMHRKVSRSVWSSNMLLTLVGSSQHRPVSSLTEMRLHPSQLHSPTHQNHVLGTLLPWYVSHHPHMPPPAFCHCPLSLPRPRLRLELRLRPQRHIPVAVGHGVGGHTRVDSGFLPRVLLHLLSNRKMTLRSMRSGLPKISSACLTTQ